jgi:hypothetical protein
MSKKMINAQSHGTQNPSMSAQLSVKSVEGEE